MCLDWFTTVKASNLGSFLVGSAAILAIILGFFGFYKWRKEKREEKKSIIAEEALNLLDSTIYKTKDWFSIAPSWLVYSRDSSENQEKIRLATDDQKKELYGNFDRDPYEFRNFVRTIYVIMDDFIKIMNHSARLRNIEINEKLEKINHIIEKLPSSFGGYHQAIKQSEEKNKYYSFLADEAPRELNKLFEDTRSLLYNILLFNH